MTPSTDWNDALQVQLNLFVSEAWLDHQCSPRFKRAWWTAGAEEEEMAASVERSFSGEAASRAFFIMDLCDELALQLCVVLSPIFADTNKRNRAEPTLNELAAALVSVPEYSKTLNEARNHVLGIVYEFPQIVQELRREGRQGDFLPYCVSDKLDSILTSSPLREGYLRPLFSMVAICLAASGDLEIAEFDHQIKAFVKHVSKTAEVNSSHLLLVIESVSKQLSAIEMTGTDLRRGNEIIRLMRQAISDRGIAGPGSEVIFAKNQAHALFIEQRFNAAYPALAGHFARVITHKTGAYAQTLIDDFSKKTKAPHIAISVDMLDTGIDVPEILNLVFFKQVRSKSKFWQMMGRGTRLCEGLFGPGQDKEFFRVFDYCQNLDFFGANPELKEAGTAKSLSERLFASRIDLVRALDEKAVKSDGFSADAQAPYSGAGDPPPSEAVIREGALKTLQDTVTGLNLDNFLVRQHRRAVEKYREPKAWVPVDDDKRKELVEEIAPLPSERGFGTEEAKRFDLLMFSLQLALLKGSKRFDTLKKQLLEIGSALEDQTGIPAIAHQAVLIEEIQTDQWWEGVTVPLLELVRLRLRDLVQHIETIVYSNFADEIGEGIEHELPQVGQTDFARFKQKARHFLKAHEDHIVLHKLRQGKPLTPTDLSELEKMLLDAGIGEAGDIERARETSNGFGRFVRSIVGLDRAAVREAFGEFLAAGVATANQIEFINMVIEHLTDQGVMDPALLYEPPFTDVAPTGPDQLFDEQQVTQLFKKIKSINESAVA